MTLWDDRILITGAAGSVGRALSLELAARGCRALGLLDHFDHGLLDTLEAVQRTVPGLPAVDLLCDVRDRERLTTVLGRFRPTTVFHCAALKHVHLGERHPAECILTNLIAVRNVLTAAVTAGARQFVLVSSDKAAAPVCVMGATKRLAELYLTGFQREFAPPTALKSVRFGNVAGSQGSVIPRFASQIEAGGPLQVTDAAMHRFFMSIDEAVEFVLDVAALEHGPEAATYYREMGDAVSVLALGRRMIEESGKSIAVEFTGLRPGEKLGEQLFDDEELVTPTALANVFRLTPKSANSFVSSWTLRELEEAVRSRDDAFVRADVFRVLDACLDRRYQATG